MSSNISEKRKACKLQAPFTPNGTGSVLLEAKKFLEEYAAKKNWSISLLVQLIVSQWIEDHKDSSNHE